MRELNRAARLYILAMIGGALALFAVAPLHLVGSTGPQSPVLLLAIVATGALAQVLKVEGPTRRSSYNLGLVLYGFALILVGSWGAIAVAVVASLVEWAWRRYPWFIQAFNIAALVLTLAGTQAFYSLVVDGHPNASYVGALAAVVAIIVFVLLNHLLVGIVIRLARGENFRESGVFGRLTLVMDSTLFGTGLAAGLLWLVNPYVAPLLLLPLYLISVSLRVPSLERQATTDGKTGLYNARYFDEALQRELSRATRFDRPLCVCVADLDLLRNINNTYGHLAGDEVIIGVSRILRDLFRDYDVIARYGGEEFTLLLPETTVAQALPRIERLRLAIAAARFDVATSTEPIQVTMSFGLAERGPASETFRQLIHEADLAVYKAKLEGRNRVAVSEPRNGHPKRTHGPVLVAPGAWLPDEMPQQSTSEMPAKTAAICGLSASNSGENAGGESPIPDVPARIRTTRVTLLIASVALVAFSWFFISLPLLSTGHTNWLGILFFAAIAFISESLSVDIYVKDSSVSTSAAPFIAGSILFGPVGALVLGFSLAAAAMLKHRSPADRFVFNAGTHLFAGLGAAWIVKLFAVWTPWDSVWVKLGAGVLCGAILYSTTTSLVSTAIAFASGSGIRRVWTTRFRWLAPYYVGLGIVGFALVFGYSYAGYAGTLAVLAPLLILRYSQRQYIGHTKGLVAELRTKNKQLSRRSDEITELNEELLLVLSKAADLRDPYLAGHSEHVARYAQLLAKELGLPPERMDLVRRAGLLHDIGKLGIPETVLLKPGSLSEAEYEAIKRHSALACQILGNCKSLGSLISIVLHHHERYDGTGYPGELSGESIPLESRILALADSLEAMASDRPYRQARAFGSILEEIKQNAGSQFDPQVVSALERIVEREGETLVSNSAVQVRARSGDSGEATSITGGAWVYPRVPLSPAMAAALNFSTDPS